VEHSLEAAYDHYREMLSAGMEGTVINKMTAIWRDATSKDQIKLKLKLKLEADCELRVTGFEPGNGKNEATFGSLLCESECGQLKVAVSGISDDLRQAIHDARDKWEGAIIQVRSNSIMKPSKPGKPYSLFLPRFISQRLDKPWADTLPRIQEQFENAVKAA
jgi:DNA ligase-1